MKSNTIDKRLQMGNISDMLASRPEFDRISKHRESVAMCVAFISYLQVLGCVVMPPKDYPVTMRDALCGFFGINRSALQKETKDISDSYTGAPCPEKTK